MGQLGYKAKYGIAYSPLFEFQPTFQVEILNKHKYSLDLGYAKKKEEKDTYYGLVGVSRDITEDLDIGAGYTTDFKGNHSYYIGFSLQF